MKYCILIELSKKKIAFLYNRSDGEGKFTPFVGDGSALPLAIYCIGNDISIGKIALDEAMNNSPYAFTNIFEISKVVGTYKFKGTECHYNTLLKNAIERYLAHFFDTTLFGQFGRLDTNIANMPLCFVFNADITENERLFVKTSFQNSGYANMAFFDYDQELVKASTFSSPYAACITSDSKDLMISLYNTDSCKCLDKITIEGKGWDPRVEVAINKMWDSLGYETYFLNYDKEFHILKKSAEQFLSSGDQEFQGEILFSDGNRRGCFVSLSELDYIHCQDDGIIASKLKQILSQKQISPLDCTIALKGRTANNKYFIQMFKGEFSSIVNVNDSFHAHVFSQILDKIKDLNYQLNESHSAPSQQTNTISANLKKKVREQLAEIKGKIRINNFEDAGHMADELLLYLHNEQIHDWDIDIEDLLVQIRSNLGTKNPNVINSQPNKVFEEKQETIIITPREDPKQYSREVRTQIAEAKAKIRINDAQTAKSILLTLKKTMNSKGIVAYDDEINDILNTLRVEDAKNLKVNSSSEEKDKTQKMSSAEILLTSGNFSDAKKTFAAEGNSSMAQICSELIKSKRTLSYYESGLTATVRNKNKSVASTAIRELSNIIKLYKTYNIDYCKIDELINHYKNI